MCGEETSLFLPAGAAGSTVSDDFPSLGGGEMSHLLSPSCVSSRGDGGGTSCFLPTRECNLEVAGVLMVGKYAGGELILCL